VSDLTGDRAAAPYTRRELEESADWIEHVQLANGFVPWMPGGHGDPWNHVESLMALSALGRISSAERGYEWLRAAQRRDGPWHAYYLSDGAIEEPRLDTNVAAYVATGVWQHFLTTRDRGFLETMWPTVDRVISWVVAQQRPGGGFTWAVDPDGSPGSFALLTASSSICTSVDAAVHAANELGHERASWSSAAAAGRVAIRTRPEEFAAKAEFAMDWYYPVLAAAVLGASASARLVADWSTWVIDGRGVRCRSDGEWVTTAETAECAIACTLVGEFGRARDLLVWSRRQRRRDGSFSTGLVGAGDVEFPEGERTTYSAAAIMLACGILAGEPSLRGVFGASRRTEDAGPVEVTAGIATL